MTIILHDIANIVQLKTTLGDQYDDIIKDEENTFKVFVTNYSYYKVLSQNNRVLEETIAGTSLIDQFQNYYIYTRNGIEQDDEIVCFLAILLSKEGGIKKENLIIFTGDNYEKDSHGNGEGPVFTPLEI